jgi:hypothetical protein
MPLIVNVTYWVLAGSEARVVDVVPVFIISALRRRDTIIRKLFLSTPRSVSHRVLVFPFNSLEKVEREEKVERVVRPRRARRLLNHEVPRPDFNSPSVVCTVS